MRTTFDAVDIVWKKLNTSLSGTITGGVFKYSRPFNSQLEDVVINSLPINEGSIQNCILNINCFVQNIPAKINGVQNDNIPNSRRLSTIAAFVVSELAEISGDDFYFFVSSQAMLQNEGANEHYINIRLDFKFLNH